ncbi:helix-turn-helix domain-containing protein [Rhodopila sp.]|uniref:helix-turn-helix domain-containing protein n=1 Tax=Rhodopila sp. TaxID=2480087 RepID=UPI003D1465E3
MRQNYPMTEAAAIAGVSLMTAYRAMNTGALATLKIGSRRFVEPQELHRWMHSK